MKKIIAFSVLVCLMTACVSTQTVYQTDNYKRLSIGMSKWEVENWIGLPLRYLDARRTPYGYEEIILYRNRYNEYFALEFVNDYLVAADYVYDGGWYPMYSYHNRPPFGKPVFPPSYRPNHPYYPPSGVQPGRPSQPNNPQRPPSSPRPDNHSQAPSYERPASTTRPSTNDRPASTNERPASTTRPSGDERPASGTTSRPSSTGTSNSGSRESTQPSSTRSSNSSTGTTTNTRSSSSERSTNQSSGTSTRSN